MSRETLIGFECADPARGIVGGDPVRIPLAHTAVCGETQASGKTTALEAYITRLGITAVAFLTKRGEAGFRLQTEIPPYFREPEISAETPMWHWVASIFESMDQTIGRDERVVIIEASEDVLEREQYKVKGETRVRLVSSGKRVKSLEDVAENVRLMDQVTTRGRTKAALTLLNAYFKMVLPQIARLKSSPRLELQPGINVMNLIGIPLNMQMLIIRSVIEEIYLRRRKTGVVIPECAKILPRMRNSPVRVAAEMFTREGLAIGNILMLDSQDLANVATETLKSMGVWLLGKQSELNERKRLAEYIPSSPKITPDQIMQLGKGEFYVVANGTARKTYIMPAGMEELHAKAIARGEIDASSWNDIRKRLDKADRRPTFTLDEKTEDLADDETDVGDDLQQVEADRAASDGELPGGIGGPQPGPIQTENEAVAAAGGEACTDESEEEMTRVALVLSNDPKSLQQQVLMLVELLRKHVGEDVIEGALRNAPMAAGLPPVAPAAPVNLEVKAIALNGHMAEFLREIRKHPEVIELLRQQPEIRVTVERPTLEMDGSTPQGRIGRLITEKFFADSRSEDEITKEFKRRGWLGQQRYFADLRLSFHRIVELGFLTKEDGGSYQAVPGMKVSTHEVK